MLLREQEKGLTQFSANKTILLKHRYLYLCGKELNMGEKTVRDMEQLPFLCLPFFSVFGYYHVQAFEMKNVNLAEIHNVRVCFDI